MLFIIDLFRVHNPTSSYNRSIHYKNVLKWKNKEKEIRNSK